MKDSYYFPHDSNATDDPKIMLLISEWGLEGYGIYWIIIEHLRNQPGYKSNLKILKALAMRYQSSEEKFKTVITRYELFKIENDQIFFSESLVRRLLPLDQKRKKLSEAGKRGNAKRWGSQGESGGESGGDRISSQSKEEEIKEENNKEEDVYIPYSKYLGDSNYKPPELPEKAKKLLQEISDFFNIREHEENQIYRKVYKFIEHMLEEKLFDQLKDSFATYARNKSSGEFKHGIEKWIGTYDKNYRDGIWFQIKPEKIEPRVTPFKRPARYRDLLELQKKYAGDGTKKNSTSGRPA